VKRGKRGIFRVFLSDFQEKRGLSAKIVIAEPKELINIVRTQGGD
jgi:hypothetical protein